MKLYKLTDQNSRTRSATTPTALTQWGEGVSHTATGIGTRLCSSGVMSY